MAKQLRRAPPYGAGTADASEFEAMQASAAMAAGRVEGMSISNEPMDAASWNAPIALSRKQMSLSPCRPQRAAPTGALTNVLRALVAWLFRTSGNGTAGRDLCGAAWLRSALDASPRSRIRQRCAGT
jgi:hypothetical protein